MPRACMLDFETWGQVPGCMLRSIGAAIFMPHGGPIIAEFYANIDEPSQEKLGLTKEQSTVDWWAKQSVDAQQALTMDQKPIEQVLREFHSFWMANRCEAVWAQGSNFDPPIWEEVCRRLKVPAPWKFWNTRDTRTVYDMATFDPRSLRRLGTHHNALDDAKFQVKCVQTALSKFMGTNPPKAA